MCDDPRNLGAAPGFRLDTLFTRTAQQQYTSELLFSSLVQLMSEGVLGVHPTVHAAYQANRATIGMSTTALYNKLDRVETRLMRPWYAILLSQAAHECTWAFP